MTLVGERAFERWSAPRLILCQLSKRDRLRWCAAVWFHASITPQPILMMIKVRCPGHARHFALIHGAPRTNVGALSGSFIEYPSDHTNSTSFQSVYRYTDFPYQYRSYANFLIILGILTSEKCLFFSFVCNLEIRPFLTNRVPEMFIIKDFRRLVCFGAIFGGSDPWSGFRPNTLP